MSDYHRKKGKYRMPRTVYHRVLWRVRDYERLKLLADDLIQAKKDDEGGHGPGNEIADKVLSTVIKRERYMNDVFAIDKALRSIPPEYRKGVWESIIYGKPYPRDANRVTYSDYKSLFLYNAAVELGIL